MGMIARILGTAGTIRRAGDVPGPAGAAVARRRDRAVAIGATTREALHVPRSGGFDRFVNALNRLPRPFLALGSLGLFAYAMADPDGFALRMAGLGHVPEPLWWLLGAIVSFYFGAREAFYFRVRNAPPVAGREAARSAASPANTAARAPDLPGDTLDMAEAWQADRYR